MKEEYISGFSNISSKFIIAFFITLFIGFILFSGNFVNIGFIIYAVLTVVLFFYGSVRFSRFFQNKSSSNYTKTIFYYTFFIRLLFIISIYIYFYLHNTEIISYPFNSFLFAPNAGDATGYHYIPMWMAEDFWNNKLNLTHYLELSGGISDYGYMLYMFPWYVIFGPHLWLHGLSNLIVGSWSVVLVYKIAKNQYNHEIGILASVLMMLMPFFYYYSAEALKEMVLIWLSLNCIYYLQNYILEKGWMLKNFFLGILFLLSITLFRTFLAGILMIAFSTALLLKKKHNRFKTIIYSLSAIIALILLVRFSYLGSELGNTADSSIGFFGKNIERYSVNSIAFKLANIPSYLLFVIAGPFPSFVYVEGQENIFLSMNGCFVRNFLMFFYLIGIFYLIKSDFRGNLFLLMILMGYFFVLAYSGYAGSSRYHLPMVPLIMIFSALGIYKITTGQKAFLVPYLFIIVIVILIWNYIKLAGRGIV